MSDLSDLLNTNSVFVDNSANWDAAFVWDDHSTFNYAVTNATNTFADRQTFDGGFNSTNITDWNVGDLEYGMHPVKSGFQATNNPGGGNYHTGFQFRHSLPGDYLTQMAFSSSSGEPNMYLRSKVAGVYEANWRKILHEGNHIAGTDYNSVIGTDSDMNTTNAQVIDLLTMDKGVITNWTVRDLTPADIGALALTGGSLTGDLSLVSEDPILTIRDSSTSTVAANATLRLAESGAGDTLDNYWDIGMVSNAGLPPLEISINGTAVLTLDSAQDATFYGDITINRADGDIATLKIGGGNNPSTVAGEINAQIDFVSNDASVNNAGQIAGRIASITENTNGALVGLSFQTFNQAGSPQLEEALRLENTGDAIFAGSITVPGTVTTGTATRGGEFTNANVNFYGTNASQAGGILYSQAEGGTNVVGFGSHWNGSAETITTAFAVGTGGTWYNGDLFKIGSTGNLFVKQFIYHMDDTDTYMEFTTDQWNLRTGGTNRLTVNNTNATFSDNVVIATNKSFNDGTNLQTDARFSTRHGSNAFEFGHSNQAGYGSTIGANTSNGFPFLAFFAEAGTTANTFRTRGIAGQVIQANTNGTLTINSVPTASADNQALTKLFDLDNTGNLGIANKLRTISNPTHSFLDLDDDVSTWSGATNNVTLASISSMQFIIDTNNNGVSDGFYWGKDGLDPSTSTEIMSLSNDGSLDVLSHIGLSAGTIKTYGNGYNTIQFGSMLNIMGNGSGGNDLYIASGMHWTGTDWVNSEATTTTSRLAMVGNTLSFLTGAGGVINAGAAEVNRFQIDSSGNTTLTGILTSGNIFVDRLDSKSDNNLHLNAHNTRTIHLNWHNGTGGVIFNNGAGTGVLNVNSTGQMTQTLDATLGSVLNDYLLNASFNGGNGNEGYLEIGQMRDVAGADWTTAGFRIQEKIDSSYMAYIQFNSGSAGNGGISFGTGQNAARDLITERFYINSAGTATFTASLVCDFDFFARRSFLRRGVNGSYGTDAGTGTDWGAAIWSIGSSFDGGQNSGSAFTGAGQYGIAWARTTSAAHDALVGEGLYVHQNGTLWGGMGTAGMISSTTGDGGRLTLRNADTTIILDQMIGRIHFDSVDVSGGGAGTKAAIRAISSHATDARTRLQFSTSTSVTNDVLALILDENQDATFSGNVTATTDITFGSNIHGNAGRTYFRNGGDNWCRLNDQGDWVSGIYMGTSIARTDGEFQVGGSGANFRVESDGRLRAAENFVVLEKTVNEVSNGNMLIRSGALTGWGTGFRQGGIQWTTSDTSGIGIRNIASIEAINQVGNGSTTTTSSTELQFSTSAQNANVALALTLDNAQNAIFEGHINLVSAKTIVFEGTTLGDDLTLSSNTASQYLYVDNADGQWFVGCGNSTYCHYDTDRSWHKFNQQIRIAGHVAPHADSLYQSGTNTLRWSNTYTDLVTCTGVCTAASYDTSSDLRLKDIHGVYNDTSAKYVQAQWYDFKDGSVVNQLGYIAQEVEEVLPEAVTTNDETGMKAVNYDMVHTAKIAELETKVSELTQLVKQLLGNKQ